MRLASCNSFLDAELIRGARSGKMARSPQDSCQIRAATIRRTRRARGCGLRFVARGGQGEYPRFPAAASKRASEICEIPVVFRVVRRRGQSYIWYDNIYTRHMYVYFIPLYHELCILCSDKALSVTKTPNETSTTTTTPALSVYSSFICCRAFRVSRWCRTK